jgi:hypothetical protein
MKVYLFDDGERRLVGSADVPEGQRASYEVPLSGPASTMVERFIIGVVTHWPECGGTPVVEWAVLLGPGQQAEMLPGWVPLT